MTCEVMTKWGLTVHVGHEDKKSKTELMLAPSGSTIARWKKGESITMDKVEMNVEMGVEKVIKKRVNLEHAHDKADEMRDTSADTKGGKLAFAKKLYVFGI